LEDVASRNGAFAVLVVLGRGSIRYLAPADFTRSYRQHRNLCVLLDISADSNAQTFFINGVRAWSITIFFIR
jgi:hypothetical protein